MTPVAKTAAVAKTAPVVKTEKTDHIASIASVTPVAEKQVVPVADRTSVVAPLPAKEDAGLEMTDRVLIQKGDSLWKLAAEHLGDGTRWPELARLNPEIADPNLVRIGEWVRVREEKGDTSKHVVVQPGDTLSKVAQAEFGDARALTCIEQANPAVHSVDRIYPGEKLILPPTCDVTR
jgi:nucleoid-associated protein YgaU